MPRAQGTVAASLQSPDAHIGWDSKQRLCTGQEVNRKDRGHRTGAQATMGS